MAAEAREDRQELNIVLKKLLRELQKKLLEFPFINLVHTRTSTDSTAFDILLSLKHSPQLTHCNILSIRTITLSAETEQICSMK